ncbi:MAG TPA: septation regulator SpoVG [Spirochaetota bacterium]|nr:septation regulator SpoVG [Spirochaetota bacterium]
MNITDVKIRKTKEENSKLKAVASITINGCFAVHDIKIIEGDKGLFIAMPSRKTVEGTYKDIVHPINTPTRNEITNLILSAYQNYEE